MIGKRSPEKDQDYYNGLIEIIWSNVLDVKSELTGLKEEVNINHPFKEDQGYVSPQNLPTQKNTLREYFEDYLPGKRPIKVFSNRNEAYDCLYYWLEKLYLTDWAIKLKFVRISEEPLNDEQSGDVHRVFEQKAAIITLPLPDDNFLDTCKSSVARVGHEQSLVHELLHLKEDPVQFIEDGDYTAGFYNKHKHTEIEMMARTLLMVKYNLPPSYFNNVDRKENDNGLWHKETEDTEETQKE